jgi:hypothetical protein
MERHVLVDTLLERLDRGGVRIDRCAFALGDRRGRMNYGQ